MVRMLGIGRARDSPSSDRDWRVPGRRVELCGRCVVARRAGQGWRGSNAPRAKSTSITISREGDLRPNKVFSEKFFQSQPS
eukprot:79800-Pleurochrysis_carterae.AAC.5